MKGLSISAITGKGIQTSDVNSIGVFRSVIVIGSTKLIKWSIQMVGYIDRKFCQAY